MENKISLVPLDGACSLNSCHNYVADDLELVELAQGSKCALELAAKRVCTSFSTLYFERHGSALVRWSQPIVAVILVVAVALVVVACEPAAPKPPGLDPGITVSFVQLNWLDDAGDVRFANSRVGVAMFNFGDTAAASLVGDGRFVNVFTDIDGALAWSVQNLFLRYPSTERMMSSSPSVQFAITAENGTRVADLRYALSITSEPLVAYIGPPDSPASVVPDDYHAGGFNGGGTGLSDLPLIIGPWVGPDPFAGQLEESALTVRGGRDLETVDEEINGCAPGAVARSIKYMLDQMDRVPDDLRDIDVQDIYESLKDLMGTDNVGTNVDELLEGKAAWAGNDLPIVTEKAGWSGQGIQDAIDAIKDRGDVEIRISLSGGGGHAAMVTSIVRFNNGQLQITYIDDPTQGDGEAENQAHVITVNPDASFKGGTIRGFVVERIESKGRD